MVRSLCLPTETTLISSGVRFVSVSMNVYELHKHHTVPESFPTCVQRPGTDRDRNELLYTLRSYSVSKLVTEVVPTFHLETEKYSPT